MIHHILYVLYIIKSSMIDYILYTMYYMSQGVGCMFEERVLKSSWVGRKIQPPGWRNMAVSKDYGPHCRSPDNKDHNTFGSILGPTIYGSPHMIVTQAYRVHMGISKKQGQGTTYLQKLLYNGHPER